ncbi:MAG: dockerin type I domain-containing protein [Candidatus Marinimicrobia bacterium]|nr:dockerin type I domain-containing protein [Candidatus Neomarinimicrobiota bacterium]MDD5539103.1 dockerin type I domain-containing protein [Candidatus Neomarinimicrobiota bacterium]
MAVYDAIYDLNNDGLIDEIDYSIYWSHWGAVDPSDPMSVRCDFNKDGVVDFKDFTLFKSHFGTEKPPQKELGSIPAIITVALILGLVVVKKHKKV